jgi:hypothetical protein
MQFGKIHGLALIALGAVLPCIQAMLYLAPKEVSGGAIETSISKTEHKTNPVRGNPWRCIPNRRYGHLFYDAASRRTRCGTRRQVGANILPGLRLGLVEARTAAARIRDAAKVPEMGLCAP